MSRAPLWRCVAALALLTGTPLLSGASANAPPQALNKTVSVSFSLAIPARCSDGSSTQAARSVARQIYISTKGRLFAKMSSSVADHQRTFSKQSDIEPSSSSPVRFSGNKILVTFVTVSGARQEIISFDPAFKTCTVNVIVGRSSGKPFVWISLNGRLVCTATGNAILSNTSCSVSEGNSLAQ